MARNAVFPQVILLTLAMLCFAFSASAQAPAPPAEQDAPKALSSTSQNAAGGPSPLQGKTLVVRLYHSDGAPAAFQRIEVKIHHENGAAGALEALAKGPMPHFLLDKKEILEDSALLLLHEDQTDHTVKEYLGNGIQSPLVQKGRCYFCLNRRGRNVLVADALGAPIADAVLELSFNLSSRKKTFPVRYGSWRTDAGGYAELPEMGAFVLVAEAFVAQPAYGTACITNPDYMNRIDTPLVAQGSEARERALRGRVVDADDRPVAAAMVAVDSVTPSGGISSHLSPPAMVLTDTSGYFAVLAANSKLPTQSLYRYSVKPPAGAACVKCDGESGNDAETVIRLERGTFHTFAFKNTSGRVMDNNKIGCTITGKGTRFDLDSDEVRSGAVLADGTYSATMWHFTREELSSDHGNDARILVSEPISFPDIEVTGSSPKELVFTLRDLVFRGEILHAKTQAPLEGVLVTMGGLPSKALQPGEQEWLSPLPSKTDTDTARVPIFTRTGKDGHFELTLKPGQKVDDLGLSALNFLPYKYKTKDRKPDADGIVDLEKIPMFPAGMLVLQVNSDHPDEQYAATCKIEEPAPHLCALPHWDKILAGLVNPRAYFWDTNWHRVSRVEYMCIPAEMAVSVELRSIMDSARGFVLPRRFTLAQGELLSLAPVTLQPPIKVPVHVLDEHGNPYEGVFVDSTTGGLTHAPVRTDAKGVAVIPLAPDSNGIMSIAEDSLSGSGPAVVACHFLLHGDIPEKSPYVLVLPRQDAPRVFGDASKTDSGKSPPTLVSPNHDPSRVFGDTPNTDSFPLPKLRLRRPY